MRLFSLTLKSLRQRKAGVALTVFTIALSVFLLLGVERVRIEARQGFASTVSGTDLLVGARSGPVTLLLYSIFHIGEATNNITWKSYQDIRAMPEVAWTVPLSLGDSHRGFRVTGTSTAFFDHYHYGRGNALAFASGKPFSDLYDAVIGSEVARQLHYKVGDSLVLSHGLGGPHLASHADKPFRVSGVMSPTGTPVDATIAVSLEAIEAIHVDWHSGIRLPGMEASAEQARHMDLTPKAITATLVGLRSRLSAFAVQRAINEYPEEPLLAVLPGVALGELWHLVGTAENALRVVSGMVLLVGMSGMLTALLGMLGERRREMAVLRAVGASTRTVFALLVMESTLLTIGGMLAGVALLDAATALAHDYLISTAGLVIDGTPAPGEWPLLLLVLALGSLAGCIPGWVAYRRSLADGLQVRL
ncbi:putative ABC transport system permease protein [Luteibacter jiangsuensis]|uniref:ABC transport system permease protein n=1 Tax=Luteibacter jiangsuensis TaxID=637577 RepID=A0ABT9STI5_9GAMM|nr:FtsX-like permease family protein [Luteibacter jiangsuensis]MDQ0008299.1 putative ABC transport system permease protein [Luteibacter jiangsuensis]